jgi:hypothetical protein
MDHRVELTGHRDGYSAATVTTTLNGVMYLARALALVEPEPWEQALHDALRRAFNKALTEAVEADRTGKFQ